MKKPVKQIPSYTQLIKSISKSKTTNQLWKLENKVANYRGSYKRWKIILQKYNSKNWRLRRKKHKWLTRSSLNPQALSKN